MSDLVTRIHRAVLFIEDHLEDDFKLSDASNTACYSHYHFLRTFLSLTGLTVGSYIRRRRLTKAAEALILTDRRVLDIAIESGFESQAAFGRAFKSMFLKTPARYRQDKTMTAIGQPAMTEAYIHHLKKGAVTMTPRFERKEKFTVIGLGEDAPIGKLMDKLWDKFLSQKQAIKGVSGPEAYGVCYVAHDQQKGGDQFHYTAALPVQADSPVPKGMEKIVIPAQEYAVFTHKGHILNIFKTNEYIWKTWMPQSGYEPVDSPDFELYDERFKGDSEESEFDIYVPVKRS